MSTTNTHNTQRPATRYTSRRCPRCRSTNTYVASTPASRSRRGVDRDGLPYDQIVTQRCKCRACGAAFVIQALKYNEPDDSTPETTANP